MFFRAELGKLCLQLLHTETLKFIIFLVFVAHWLSGKEKYSGVTYPDCPDPPRQTQASQFLPHQASRSRFKHRSCLRWELRYNTLRAVNWVFWSSNLATKLHSHSEAVQKHGNAKNHQCFLPGVNANYRLAFQDLTGGYSWFCLGFSYTCRHTKCKKIKEGTNLLCNLPYNFYWQNKSQNICHPLLKMWFQTQHFSLDQQEGCVHPLSISSYIKINALKWKNLQTSTICVRTEDIFSFFFFQISCSLLKLPDFF